MTAQTPPVLSGGLPVVGHAVEMLKNRDDLFRRGYREHGDIFTINLGNRKVVILGDKAYNRVFYTETDKALNIGETYDFLQAAIGDVLFIAGPDVYYNQRPVVMEVFRRERMEQYIRAMNSEIQRWLDGLGQEGTTDISGDMQRLTQYVAAHAFLGPNFRDELGERFWNAYNDISKSLNPILPPHLPLPKFIKRDRAKQLIRETFAELAAKRRQNPDQYDDLIALLLTTPQKDGTFMDDKDIATMFTALMFAGHETTAGQAAWTIIQLLQHPAYLDAVQAEIQQHVGYRQGIDALMLHQLDHVYWAIDETTRLRPSADVQMRLVKEPTVIGAYTIPEGWQLIVASAISHYDDATFTNPDDYDPLRHAPERKEASNPFAIVGFGGGIHKCTGMNFARNEMAVIVSHLFQQYEVELLTENPVIVRGVGANRPSTALIHYRRKSAPDAVQPSAQDAAAGCPHSHAVNAGD